MGDLGYLKVNSKRLLISHISTRPFLHGAQGAACPLDNPWGQVRLRESDGPRAAKVASRLGEGINRRQM